MSKPDQRLRHRRILHVPLAVSCRVLLWLSIICGGAAAWPAQAENFPFPPGSSLRFRHLTIESGLAQSSVQAIAQDAQGFMWLGTQDGLQRYDGYDFVTYRHDAANLESLADSNIQAIAIGADGALWVGTATGGLDRLQPASGRFTHFHHDPAKPDSLVNDSVLALLVDHAGQLWVGTAHGLDRMDNSGAFHHYRVPSTLPNADDVFTLYEDPQQHLWIGSEHGMYYYDAKHDSLRAFQPVAGVQLDTARDILGKASVTAFLWTFDHRLWVATGVGGSGIVVLDEQGTVEKLYQHEPRNTDSLVNSHVRALVQDSAGDIWIGTVGGMSRYDDATGHFSNYHHDATDPGGLGSDVINALYRDRTGLIWISADTAGADIYNPQTRAFGYYRYKQGDPNSLASNVVWSIFKGADGDLWVATDKGITRLDPSRIHYRQYKLGDRPQNRLDDDLVNVVYGDRDGGLWAGADYGLYRYLPASDSFKHYELVQPADNPNGDIVSSIYQDSHGHLWLSTGLGLALFDRGSGRVTRFRHDASRADSLPDDSVLAVCETPDRDLWAITSNGVGSFDGEHDHFRIYRSDPHDDSTLSDNDTQTCMVDRNGVLWVGTTSGLNRLDLKSGRFKRYTVQDGLPNNSIYTILQDRAGDIWISTAKGLSRFDPASATFHNYGPSDGLQSDEFNGGAAFTAADGELFFGGINGLNAFDPSHLQHNPQAPRTAITGFTRLGTQVPVDGITQPIEVQYRQNILTFQFTAFDYAAPDMNSFIYKLDGFDTDWHTVHGRRLITYTNLDPGRYTLQVRGASHDGVWSTEQASLSLQVLPPAWRSWWAYLLYTALAFVAIMLGLQLYKRSIQRDHDLGTAQQRRQWAESLHNLIQSVTALRDERAIAEQLIDAIPNFIEYDRALFYVEHDLMPTLIASRGIDVSEQNYLERWPKQNERIVARLRLADKPQLLPPDEAATLDGGGAVRGVPRHYLAVPLVSGSGAFRLLLVARSAKTIERQGLDIAAAMAKQVSVALDNAQLIKELENLATTDGLTRLYNRRHFMERAESEFERSRRYQRELSAFLLDADHFKNINDTHGHEVGDRVLRLLAGACRQSLRQLDVIGRYGGEEFVVLLPETSAALAYEAAERLRHHIEELRVPTQDKDIRVTVSIGVATAVVATDSVAALINEADRALYEAKRNGRNQVMAAASGKDRS